MKLDGQLFTSVLDKHGLAIGREFLLSLKQSEEQIEEIFDEVDEVVRNVQNWSAEDPAHQWISHDDLSKFAETFRKCAGSKGYLDREDFAKMVSSKNKFFIDRTFAIFDQLNTGRVHVDAYTETLARLVGKNADAAIEFLFRMYDINGDGRLDFTELKEVLKASMAESGMMFDEEDFESLVQVLWEDAGMGELSNRRTMTYTDLNKLFKKHPSLAMELADSIIKWIIPPQHSKQKKKVTTARRHSHRLADWSD